MSKITIKLDGSQLTVTEDGIAIKTDGTITLN